MSDAEFQKLQLDVANGDTSHFKEVEKDSEENTNTTSESEDASKDTSEETKGNEPKETKEEPKEEPKEEEKDEPKIRKSKKDYIIERLRNKANKQKSDEDDEVNPRDKKLVEDVVDEKIGSKLEELEKIAIEKEEERELLQDMKELDEFISKNEQFKPYQDKILKWWQHPTRKNLPLKAVAYEVAGDDLIALGAERERKASKEAAATATGSDSKTVILEKKISDMTDKEFIDYQNKILYGR